MSNPTASAPTGAPSRSAAYTTPTKRAGLASSSNADAGPSRVRPSGASPAYSSRRHSLYGVEDRVVINPGSRVWRVGYSGEFDPRAVVWAREGDGVMADDPASDGAGLWDLDLAQTVGAKGDRVEARRLVEGRILRLARDTYIRHLKTDPKTRKVIILESPFMPDFVKQALAKALFDNLKVPSVAFTSESVLALAACGRSTGLVVDVGWLETTVTPVFHSRPLFHYSTATPLAGQALYKRLYDILIRYATYTPPAASWSAPPPPARSVPSSVLSDRLIERIITEACFASDIIPTQWSNVQGENAEYPDREAAEAAKLDRLKQRYEAHCNARDVHFDISTPAGVGRLHVPGWIRERAVDVLFGDDDSEAEPVQHAILSVTAKLSVDLRGIMLSSILVTGGTAAMPGLIPRIRDTLLHTLELSSRTDEASHRISSPEFRAAETASWRQRHHRPYAILAPLRKRLAVLNDPCPLDVGQPGGLSEGADTVQDVAEPVRMGGKTPRWTPGLLAWVGGSLAGSLKTGGPELTREEYDTRSAIDAERGEAYHAAIQAEAEREAEAARMLAAELESTSGDEPAKSPQPPYSCRVVEGVHLEDLLPGMALMGGAGRRKRGWRGDMGVTDWSRVLRT